MIMRLAIDSNILIYYLDASSPWHEPSARLLKSAEVGGVRLTCSELVFAELLSHGSLNAAAVEHLVTILEKLPITYVPQTKEILLTAAKLRREYGLKLLDAMHVASVMKKADTSFMTNDKELLKKHIPGVRVVSLQEQIYV